MNTIRRVLQDELRAALKSYPVVTITGPRQTGKTTLVKECVTNKPYYNLEKPDVRQLLIEDPLSVLNKHPEGIIFDEVQHAPELLSYIQVLVDEKQQEGMYILTGSHQPEIQQAVTQSLAGRTAILNLLPFSIHELGHAAQGFTINDFLFNGFLPRIYDKQINPNKYYSNYVQTYLEKDVRQLINLKDILSFQRFLKLAASRIGKVLNMNGLANELGVSNHTVKNWLSILQASYVITLLPPYFENLGKRIIKSPKLYFFDVGLAAFLLDIENPSQLDRDPMRGELFENLVVMEFYKARYNQGLQPNLYYYRDAQQVEIDVIHKQGNMLTPIEIKVAQTTKKSYFNAIKYFRDLVGKQRCDTGYLVYGGEEELPYGDFASLNFKNAVEAI